MLLLVHIYHCQIHPPTTQTYKLMRQNTYSPTCMPTYRGCTQAYMCRLCVESAQKYKSDFFEKIAAAM